MQIPCIDLLLRDSYLHSISTEGKPAEKRGCTEMSQGHIKKKVPLFALLLYVYQFLWYFDLKLLINPYLPCERRLTVK